MKLKDIVNLFVGCDLYVSDNALEYVGALYVGEDSTTVSDGGNEKLKSAMNCEINFISPLDNNSIEISVDI